MKPRTSVESIWTYNIKDEGGNYIGTKISIGSWITLQPGKQGVWAKDSAKFGGASDFRGSWKARVLKFRVNKGSDVVSLVKIQHVYMHRQLHLKPEDSEGRCNYLYPSSRRVKASTDWIDVNSISGVIWVQHAEIGEALRHNRTHKELLMSGNFFHNAEYEPGLGHATFGKILRVPLPSFGDSDWPLPDMATSEEFRCRMRTDFLTAMRPNTGSRGTHLHWYMPIHVMVDLFSGIEPHRTSTQFIFRNISDADFTSLMDDGWDSKYTNGADVIKCIASRPSVIFKYHLGRSTLYVNFVYNRQRMIPGSQYWVDIDQAQRIETIQLECELLNQDDKVILKEVGLMWTLSSIRQEILMVLGYDFSEDFKMQILENELVLEKVNIRNERKKTVADVLPPKVLRIVPSVELI